MYFKNAPNIRKNVRHNIRMRISAALLVFAGLFGSLLLQACQDLEPIFASLETEEKILTGNLSDQASIQGIAQIGGKYYVSTGVAMFHRNTSGGDWVRTSLPNGYSRTQNLVQVDNAPDQQAYFTAYRETAGKVSDMALFSMDPSGAAWSLIKSIPSISVNIQLAGPTLYASVGIPGTSSFNYYKDYAGSAVQLTDSGKSEFQGLLQGVAAFKGTDYVLVKGGLYSVSGSTLTRVDIDKAATGPFGGVYAYNDGTSDVLLVADGNRLWKTLDGTTWERKQSDTGRFFTKFIYISQSAFTGVLVGTSYFAGSYGKSEGYFELDGGNIQSITRPSGNKYTSGTLNKADVGGFYVSGNTFFVLTVGSGLWRGTYSASRSVDWFQE